MKYIAIDLEMNKPSGKIIQIGWAIGEAEVENDFWYSGIATGSAIVNPQEPLDPFIVKLTGITERTIENCGGSLEEAYETLCHYLKEDVCRVPLQWGGGDCQYLKNQLMIKSFDMFLKEDARWKFARSEMDIKKVYQFYQLANGKKVQAGLAKAMTKLGLSFTGRKHDAEYDAMNTLVIARKLFSILKNK